MLTTTKRHRNSYYWCVVYPDGTERGNAATDVELLLWVTANLKSLPLEQGKFTRKLAAI